MSLYTNTRYNNWSMFDQKPNPTGFFTNFDIRKQSLYEAAVNKFPGKLKLDEPLHGYPGMKSCYFVGDVSKKDRKLISDFILGGLALVYLIFDVKEIEEKLKPYIEKHGQAPLL